MHVLLLCFGMKAKYGAEFPLLSKQQQSVAKTALLQRVSRLPVFSVIKATAKYCREACPKDGVVHRSELERRKASNRFGIRSWWTLVHATTQIAEFCDRNQ